MPDAKGNPWALVSETGAGSRLIPDDGFDCLRGGVTAVVCVDDGGLYVPCSCGHHYLNGHYGGPEYVGLWREPEAVARLPEEARAAAAPHLARGESIADIAVALARVDAPWVRDALAALTGRPVRVLPYMPESDREIILRVLAADTPDPDSRRVSSVRWPDPKKPGWTHSTPSHYDRVVAGKTIRRLKAEGVPARIIREGIRDGYVGVSP